MRALLSMSVVLALSASAALAQSGVVGTGADGCYFGRCDDQARTTTPQPTPQPQSQPQPTPQPQPQQSLLLCVTHFGTCQMAGYATEGSICNCPGLAQGFAAIGSVQDNTRVSLYSVPNVSSVCTTDYGSCQMAVSLARGQSCYCPTWNGPVWGISQ